MMRALKATGLAVVVAATVPVVCAGQAQADSGTLFFRIGGRFDCSIASNGEVGCDLTGPALAYSSVTSLVADLKLPLPIIRSIVIDTPSLPAHPTLSVATPHTVPGGNPDIRLVATSQDQYSATVAQAGAFCRVSFYDSSFLCESFGRKFTYAPVYGGLGQFFGY